MASGIDVLEANSSKVDKHETLEKKQFVCAQMLHKHLFLLSCAQSEVFSAYQNVSKGNQWDFFNLASLDVHEQLTGELVKTLNKHRPYHYLERAYSFWIDHVAPTALRSTSQQERYSCCKLAKFIASYLLLAAQYDKAVICLAHAVQLYETDYTSRFLLLQWLCHLGEWEVARAQLKTESALIGKNVHYDAIIKAFRFILEFNLSSNKEPSVDELLLLLEKEEDSTQRQDENTKKPVKTFLQYQCDAIVYRCLSIASRLPNAPLKKIGDPLKNLEMSFAKVHTLLRNRYRHFADNDKSIDLQKAAADNDSFLKLCSNVAEYCETALWLCREHLETGNVRECENIALILWLRKFRMAAYSRLLPVFSLLLDVSLLSAASHFKFEEFCHLVVTLFNVRKDKQKDTCDDLTMKERSEGKEAKTVFEPHINACDCVLCLLNCTSLQFRCELDLVRLFLNRVDTEYYMTYRKRFHEVIRYGKTWISKMKEAFKLKEWKTIVFRKDHCWLVIRKSYLLATVRWLRSNSVNEGAKAFINEALEMCKITPWHYCSQWLVLKQLNRVPLIIPAEFSWLSKSQNDSPVNVLAEGLKKITLQTPICKGRLRTTCRLRSAKATPAKLPGRKRPIPIRGMAVTMSDLKSAEEDFSNYAHLFYREWRYLIGTYLARIYAWNKHDNWRAAFMISESCTCATRQIGRAMSVEKSSFCFQNLNEFQKAVKLLPPDLTVVQLFLDSERILWLLRFCCRETPLLVPVKLLSKDNLLLKRMRKLLLENDNSGQLAKTTIDSKQFWKIRRELNNCLENITRDAQNEWLGIFAPLLLPHATFTDEGCRALEQLHCHCSFSTETSKALLESVCKLSSNEWGTLIERFALLENIDVDAHNFLDHIYKEGQDKSCPFISVHDRKYLLLSIAPELASFPFEMFPILGENQRVCRIPSLYLFHRIFSRSNEIPKCVDGQKTFYVLDPGGDLTDTQNRLSKMLQQHVFWKGIIGQPPKPEELRQYLQHNDFFLYMGHGSGGRYFGKSTIRNSDCRAVSVLMGCSSARILHEGDGFDGQSVIYDYSVARCPCLVGCLWMVTDGEIDRFLMALVKYCFSNAGCKPDNFLSNERQLFNGNEYVALGESYRLLIDAVAYARTACRLRYMTGGAVVSYGLPIVAKNASLPPTVRKIS